MTNANRKVKTNEKRNVLIVAIIFDTIGCVSYILPGFAESFDIVWAPIAAILHFFMLRGKLGWAGAGLTFTEEILPGTDIVPSFVLMWWVKYVWQAKKTANKLPEKEND